MKHFRFRDVYLFIGGTLVIFLYLVTDPNANLIQNLPFGASTIVLLSTLLKSIWYVGFLHFSRLALLDYVNLSPLFRKAEQSPEGAGRALVAVALMMVSISIVILAAVISN